jgi:hypothetical protein
MGERRSRETHAVRRRSRGWILQVGDYFLWSPDGAEVVRAAARLRSTLTSQRKPEGLAAMRRSYDPVMD